jgi:hypothetical protein
MSRIENLLAAFECVSYGVSHADRRAMAFSLARAFARQSWQRKEKIRRVIRNGTAIIRRPLRETISDLC